MKLKSNQKNSIARALSLMTQLGLNMVTSIFISLFIGKFLDSKLDTSPLFLIIFIIMGVLAAFKNLFSMVTSSWKE